MDCTLPLHSSAADTIGVTIFEFPISFRWVTFWGKRVNRPQHYSICCGSCQSMIERNGEVEWLLGVPIPRQRGRKGKAANSTTAGCPNAEDEEAWVCASDFNAGGCFGCLCPKAPSLLDGVPVSIEVIRGCVSLGGAYRSLRQCSHEILL
jgi:hypothetical protein